MRLIGRASLTLINYRALNPILLQRTATERRPRQFATNHSTLHC